MLGAEDISGSSSPIPRVGSEVPLESFETPMWLTGTYQPRGTTTACSCCSRVSEQMNQSCVSLVGMGASRVSLLGVNRLLRKTVCQYYLDVAVFFP